MPATERSFELVFDDVTAGYNGAPVVQGLSFSVRQGQRVGLIGRNGAGKTTTLATAMGLAQLQRGAVRLGGRPVGAMPTFERARLGLGYVPQGRDIFASLTVEENLVAAMHGRAVRPALEKAYGLFPRLFERRGNGGNQLSGGEQQMLAVARALVAEPRVLLLDEPLEGLAPKVRDELMQAIDRLATQTGLGCLLVEQHVDVVLDFADEVVVLERGLPVFSGSTEALRADPALLNSAIGLEKV
ncbi:ABC transporter ATP-binding protein [Variovorax sp. J31P207]|uniref:ABC transporter ATP-binding protein n=1 Tax=Variovorax sp. J31P207 TaxID=3053510 RepID=UPI002577B68E|nr:ABC transporter ATP-binding protein [Variovorax sp. J31P207]MDM0069706.1 ABC transporter ATP-binding protein [Variovorax sp. J31P207]